MSAIALIFERAGQGTNERALEPLLGAMRHRGCNGRHAVAWPGVALGHLHFWTTPEEVDECQPLVQDGLAIAWDGRLDNREALWRSLPRPPAPLASLSDAVLTLAAFRAWGDDAFARLAGPFVVVVIEPVTRTIWLARDLLGARTLSYYLSDQRLVAASEAQAVVAHPEVPKKLDERRIATYFTAGELRGSATFFVGVRELAAGHCLRVTPETWAERRFDAWQPPASEHNLDGWTARFRETFDASVACRLRAPRTPGVMLSGGLDSAPIAASAAITLADGKLPTFSWVFDHHPTSDERPFLATIEARYDFAATHIPCDDAGPFGDLATWPVHPATPEQNPYRRFHQRVYRAAHDRGVSVLLSGMGGDQLYAGTEHWLADLVQAGAWGDLGAELKWLVAEGKLMRRATLRGLVPGRWTALGRPWSRPGRGRRGRWPPWLTPEAARLLPAPGAERVPAWVRRPRQYGLVAGAMNGHGFGVEAFHAHGRGVEVRHPLRDRRLLELMLAIPTSALLTRGVRRPVVRRAFGDRLPPSIIERRGKATFEPVLRRALFDTHADLVSELLADEDALWDRYVRRDWLQPAALGPQCESTSLLVAWLCLGFELWRRAEGG